MLDSLDNFADIKASQVRVVSVPQYEGLSILEMDKQVFQHNPQVYEYFPDTVEIKKTPKQWICNVAACVLGDTYEKWVEAQIKARNAKVTKEKDLMIKMDPEMAKVFRESTAVSSKCHLEIRIS